MYCKNCGNQIDDNAVYCIHCGASTGIQQYGQPEQKQSSQSNTLAIVGFILSFFIPLAGLICSIIGLKRAPQFGGNGKGLAIAGIILSAIAILAVIVLVGIYGSVIFAAFITSGMM